MSIITNSDHASVLSSMLCPHMVYQSRAVLPGALASCVDTQSCLILDIQPNDPLKVCATRPPCPVCLSVLAILCTYIFGVGFPHHSHVFCLCIFTTIHVFKQVFNALFSLHPASFFFAVRSSRRTTRGSTSQCGNNAPRSWGDRLWCPAARPSITSWTPTNAGRQGQGGRSRTM